MLILARKKGQSIQIFDKSDNLIVEVVTHLIEGDQVKLGIITDRENLVVRSELLDKET